MTPDTYMDLKEKVRAAGYGHEIEWAENLKPVSDSWKFFTEYVWVVVNSGMKNQVARMIYDRVMRYLNIGRVDLSKVFGHKAKCKAIIRTLGKMREIFAEYEAIGSDEERIEFLQTLPWIGPITKYHLAKNLGITTVAKPDRHLTRIAKRVGKTAQKLCEEISGVTGDTVAVVDLVIWRAANLGML